MYCRVKKVGKRCSMELNDIIRRRTKQFRKIRKYYRKKLDDLEENKKVEQGKK